MNIIYDGCLLVLIFSQGLIGFPEKFLHSLYVSASGNETVTLTQNPPPMDNILEETTAQIQQAFNTLQSDPSLAIFLMFIASAFLVVFILYATTRYTISHRTLSVSLE